MPYGKLLLTTLFAFLVLSAPPGSGPACADESLTADETMLKESGIASDGASLLAFFKNRTLTDADRERLELLVRQLGSKLFRERAKAQHELISKGTPSLPLLRVALKDPDIEVSRRAKEAIARIEGGPGPDLPAAAARVLAQRKHAGAVEVLLKYLPYADDEALEEQIITSLGQLAIHDGKVDPVLTGALEDKLSARRGAAGYILGRMGDLGQRAAVRRLLGDADAGVRLRAAQGLVSKEVYRVIEGETIQSDEKLLQDQKFATDPAGLLAFFRKRTLSEEDQSLLRRLVRDLGNPVWRVRQKASHALAERGTSALPFLRVGATDPDAEIRTRATDGIKKIQDGPGPALPTAAVHLLLKHAPHAALETLLAYIPFADDDTVEDEVLNALCALSAREVKVSPALFKALDDELPARRGAAAYVLGRVGTRTDCKAALKLLEDRDPKVRFRAGQGFLDAKDKRAVPVLIDLLARAPTLELRLRAEETLQRLAAEQAPPVTVGAGTRAELVKVTQAWDQWWQKTGPRFNLALVNRGESYLGLRLVAEFPFNGRWDGGTVTEYDRFGKKRWQIPNLLGPMDAQVLPNGNVLVAETNGQRVREINPRTGTQVWIHQVQNNNPVAAIRLPNGNTFIACYYSIMEVKKDGTYVFNIHRGFNNYIFNAHRQKNGNYVCMTSTGTLVEFDKKGKEVHTLNVTNQGWWCSAEGMPNKHYLVALMSQNKVAEIDAKGKEIKTWNVPGVNTATRLPNGHILVGCMNNRLIAEYDRNGKEIWKKTVEGRPYRVHYR